MKLKTTKTKGFTLIEILIVITIIGVLAALSASALGALGGAKSRDAVRISDLNQIATMASSLTNRFNVAPMSGKGRKYPDECTATDGAALGKCLLKLKVAEPTDLVEILADPKDEATVPGGSNIFKYYYGAKDNGFKICAYMEDQGALENINAQSTGGNGQSIEGGSFTDGNGMHCIVRGSQGWEAEAKTLNIDIK